MARCTVLISTAFLAALVAACGPESRKTGATPAEPQSAAAPAPLVADALRPGDKLYYDDGIVIEFHSPTRQTVDGQPTERDSAGRRLLANGFRFTPHRGDFPEDGRLEAGKSWSTNFTSTEIGGRKRSFNPTLDCEAKSAGTVQAAGMTFPTVLVECARSTPRAGRFSTYSVHYWVDAEGRPQAVVAAETWHRRNGSKSRRLEHIERADGADAFATVAGS